MLRPKHRLEMADARDCDQEARENPITNQVPAVALESFGLRFWHRRCHAAAEGRAASVAAAEGRAASDAAAGEIRQARCARLTNFSPFILHLI